MIYFREHRSIFSESLLTEKVFCSFSDLKSFIFSNYKCKSIEIEYYCFDDRENIGDTFIIGIYDYSNNNSVLGFAYLRNF